MAVENVKIVDMMNEISSDASYADMPTIDIHKGGQWGLLPRIGGINNEAAIHEWMSEQAYQKRDVIPIVLQVPRMFDLLPNSKDWKTAVKAMMEIHAKTIDGLNSSLTVDTNEHELGLSGASFKEVADVKREATSVSITVEERLGTPFEILLDTWIRYGLMDPDLKAPLITRIVSADNLPKAWTADWKTMTVLFIEPDSLYRRAVRAWLVSNLFPESNPDITGKKDKNSGRELKEISLELGGFAVPSTNKRVRQLAQSVLTNLALWTNDSEDILLPADKIDPSLDAPTDNDVNYEGTRAKPLT